MPSTIEEYIKRGDTRPHFDVALEDLKGRPVNLTGSTITFSMRDASTDVLKVNAATCTILNSHRGECRHSWLSENTDTAGTYEGEFNVVDKDSRSQTFPSDGFVLIHVTESMN